MSVATIVRSWIGEVYLASCVRTPLGRINGALKEVNDARLGAIVIDSVLQRSAIDKTNVDHVLMESNEKVVPEMFSCAGLPETTKYSIESGLKSFVSAISLLMQGLHVTICGKALTWSQQEYKGNNEPLQQYYHIYNDIDLNNTHNCLKSLNIAQKSGVFLEEIEPIRIPGHPRLKKNPINVFEDETGTIDAQENDLMQFTTGAAACILTSKDFIRNISLTPMGKVLSFVEATSSDLSALSLLEANKLSISDISLWQINDDNFNLYHRTVTQLGIDEARVNIHGGSSLMGHSVLHGLIHLIHSLKAHQKGIVLQSTQESATSILVEKIPAKENFISPQRKPILNLFTKDPCPLCDELKLELSRYLERIQLEEVFLTPKSYWYKLYRYEIPVLFLGGKYVCRNKFNIPLFERILHNLEIEIKSKN